MKWLSADSLVNLLSGLGTARDKATGGAFGHLAISDNEADALYLSSWLGRKIVEIVPEDMTREWRAWQAEDDQITAIEAEERRLGIRKAVNDAMTWARLRGGAAIVIGDGSSDPAQEFDPASVGKGGLKYLHVVTRIQIKAGDLETDVANPNYGLPRSYTISGESGEVRIHPSRVVRFIGVKRPPDGVLVANDGWGDPIVKPIYDAIRNASSATSALAALLQEAKVDVISIPGLAGALETEKGRELLLERFSAAGMGKSIVNTLILDTDEEYEQKTIAFTGLPDVHMRLLQEVAGAADIPVTRLLGQSPAGLNSTGESDLRNYYDMIASLQENDLRPAMEILDEALIRSALGARPDEIYWTFNPLWQLTEAEKAKINLDNANALDKHVASGLIPDEVLSKGLINKLTEDGTYPGMDQALKEFEEAGDLDEFWEELTNPPEPVKQAVDPATGLPVDPKQKGATQTGDATPRTLYVSRKVLNGSEIVAWAKAQGFETTLRAEDMHVTIMFSRTPVDWMAMGEPWESKLEIAEGGPRLVEAFSGGAVVLLFKSSELEWRHRRMLDEGASWDWPEYQPHITITYGDVDIEDVEPYQGRIVLGPEIFAEVDEDWKAGVSEV